MPMRTVSEQDGIHFDLEQTIVADSRSAIGDINIVTHAHADHMLQKNAENVLCTSLTADLVSTRNNTTLEFSEEHEHVELLPSGHILGAAAAHITADDRSYLYTGDVCTRDRGYLDGFKPVAADELVIETTYGVPAYTFPDHEEIVGRIRDWMQDTAGPIFLFGYSLGRAQKIQHIIQDATNRPMTVHGAIHKVNQTIEAATDLTFNSQPYADNKEITDDTILVLPSHLSRKQWVNDLASKHNASKAGFSGWAATGSYASRGGYDVTFSLSDHCDFDELVELVQAVDPEKVYTHHGFDEAFAAFLRDEYGYNARALKDGQASLADY